MADINIDLDRHKTPELSTPIDLAKEQITPLTFSISGMTCSSCVNSVERAVNEIPGVSASVNFASETLHLLAPSGLDAKVVIKQVKSAGYEARLLEDQSNPALHRKGAARALLAASLFAFPAVAISMVMSWHPAINEWLISIFDEYNLALPPHADHSFVAWLVLAITTPLILFVAWPIHRAAIRNIFHPTMDTLVSLGAFSAYFWSIYATYTNSGEPYTEVAAGVLFFVILGRYLESRAKRRASSALSSLLALGEKEVAVMRGGVEVILPISQLIVGDEFVVKPGSRIATDGLVISGTSSVNNSMITGESSPVEVAPGSRVIGSAMNNNGRLIVRATRVGSDTELARITSMVVAAQGSKTPIQAKADKIASFFVPIVTVLAAATFEGWYLFGGKSLTDSISIAITVLVIACPCALGLATPVALLVASGRGALRGIVLRNPRALEASESIDVVVLDKTGTLTEGAMSVRNFTISTSAGKVLGADFNNLLTEKNILSTALALESQSDHPTAKSIAGFSLSQGATQLPVEQLSQTPGVGVAGRVNIGGKSPVVLIGSPVSVAHSCIPFDAEIITAIKSAENNSYAVSVLAWDGVALAVFASGDLLKSDAVETLQELHKRGITTWLLTGDNDKSAANIAHQVGISSTHIVAHAMPEDKLAKVKSLQQEGHRVLMIGDGVNDAAALAQADLSIAMGTGTDAAMSSADITLMRPHLVAVIEALDLSKKTLSTIKGNLVWAFAYNVIGLPIAALGFATPMYAAAAMAVSSLFVVSNSLRLK